MSDFPDIDLYEQPNSPTVQNDKFEFVYKGLSGTGAAGLAYIRMLYERGETFRGYWIDMDSCRWQHDYQLDTLTISCKSSEAVPNVSPKVGERTFSMSMNWTEVPIELHPSYRAIWNNNFFQSVEATKKNLESPSLSAPSGLEQEKTTFLAAGLQFKYKWSKTQPPDFSADGKTYRWFMVKAMTNPGLEVFRYPAPIVTERFYCASENAARAACALFNSHKAPAVTFGITGSAQNWLVCPDGVEYDGKIYSCVTRYMWAKEWKKELYP